MFWPFKASSAACVKDGSIPAIKMGNHTDRHINLSILSIIHRRLLLLISIILIDTVGIPTFHVSQFHLSPPLSLSLSLSLFFWCGYI